MKQMTLVVTEMSCAGCEGNVTDPLEGLKRVATARPDRETDEGRVEHDETTIDTASLAGTIEDAGDAVDD